MGQLLSVSEDIFGLCSTLWRDKDQGLFALTAVTSFRRERPWSLAVLGQGGRSGQAPEGHPAISLGSVTHPQPPQQDISCTVHPQCCICSAWLPEAGRAGKLEGWL